MLDQASNTFEAPSRRNFIATISATALSSAVIAPALASGADNDAELLSLDAQLGSIYREWIVHRISNHDRCDELLEDMELVTERMRLLQPRSLAGFAAKASILLTECIDMEGHIQLWSREEENLDFDLLIAWNFVNEMRASAGLGPSPIRNV